MMSLTGNYAEIKATDLRKLKNLRAVNTSKAIQGNLKKYCKNLKNNKITVSSEMKKFGKFLIENKKLIEYTGNSEVVKIPKGVKVIEDIVFRDENKIREMLNIPAEETIVSVIALGYKDIEVDRPKRKSVDDICKFY